MNLTETQSGVLKRMALGGCTAFVIVIAGSWLNPFSFDQSLSDIGRISIAIQSALLPLLFLVISIGRLARHRFFTPDDIDGSGLTESTEQAVILQSLLQNTLEQFCLALLVYLAWAITMPATWMSVIPLAAIAFAIGRILFLSGYRHGAPSRALGFTLTFYPSVVMLLVILCNLGWRIVN